MKNRMILTAFFINKETILLLMFLIKGFNYIAGRYFNSKKVHVNFSLNYYNRKRDIDIQNLDYIRLASLELMAHEINTKGLPGSVAENHDVVRFVLEADLRSALGKDRRGKRSCRVHQRPGSSVEFFLDSRRPVRSGSVSIA